MKEEDHHDDQPEPDADAVRAEVRRPPRQPEERRHRAAGPKAERQGERHEDHAEQQAPADAVARRGAASQAVREGLEALHPVSSPEALDRDHLGDREGDEPALEEVPRAAEHERERAREERIPEERARDERAPAASRQEERAQPRHGFFVSVCSM
jgi:hypothetical protein